MRLFKSKSTTSSTECIHTTPNTAKPCQIDKQRSSRCTQSVCVLHGGMWACVACNCVLILHHLWQPYFYVGLTLCTIFVDSWLYSNRTVHTWWLDRITRFYFAFIFITSLSFGPPSKDKIHSSSSKLVAFNFGS